MSKRVEELFDRTMMHDDNLKGVTSINEIQQNSEEEDDEIQQITNIREQQLHEQTETVPIQNWNVPQQENEGYNFIQEKEDFVIKEKNDKSMYHLIIITIIGFILFIILSLPYVNKIQMNIYKGIILRGIIFAILFILIIQILI